MNDNGHIHDISLRLHKGEVLGIGALDGQGQTEMLQTLAGVRHRSSGSVILNGTELKYQGSKESTEIWNRLCAGEQKGAGTLPEIICAG